jgi:hypothetical protein
MSLSLITGSERGYRPWPTGTSAIPLSSLPPTKADC